MAETERRSYELLRLTQLKYPDSLYTFIDLRFFQRGWDDDSGNEVYNPTKKGVQIKEDQFQHLIGKWTLVPSLLFHSLIIKNDYPAMRREEFDTAVFRVFNVGNGDAHEIMHFDPRADHERCPCKQEACPTTSSTGC